MSKKISLLNLMKKLNVAWCAFSSSRFSTVQKITDVQAFTNHTRRVTLVVGSNRWPESFGSIMSDSDGLRSKTRAHGLPLLVLAVPLQRMLAR
eukprot:scaffold676_cov316-Pavlova_lutheri.AAC.51